MATRTVMTCDLDHGGDLEEGETTDLAIDGLEVELELCPRHRKELSAELARYLEAARTIKTPRRRPTTGEAEERRLIREWANENGYDVGDRGRIPTAVLEAYADAMLRKGGRKKASA